ncbi:hypothetical protein MMC30_005704 [Trapelia coarctata]|nr:hypothetical protein [Trapelia coarctata]
MSRAVGTSMASGAGHTAQRLLHGGKTWSTVASQPFSPSLAENQSFTLSSSSTLERGNRPQRRGHDPIDNPGPMHVGIPSQPGFLHPKDWLHQEEKLQQETRGGSSIGPPTGPRSQAWSNNRDGSAVYAPLRHTPYVTDRNDTRSLASNHHGGRRYAGSDARSHSGYTYQVKLGPMGTPEGTKAQYKVGMIFRAAFHEPHRRNGNARAGNTTDLSTIQDPKMASMIQQTTSTALGNVHSKVRPMIVVGLYETHYVALPLYTHSGNGLQQVKNPLEYVSIRDHRSQEPFNKLSQWNPLVTGRMDEDTHLMQVKSTVHLTYPISRNYETEGTRMGFLDAQSTIYLTELYLYFLPQPQNKPALADRKASIKIETLKLDAAKEHVMNRKMVLKVKKAKGGDPSELLGYTEATMDALQNLIEVFEKKLTLIETIPEITKVKPDYPTKKSSRKVETVLEDLEEGEIMEY